jgi:hypothetical protein
VHRDLLRAAQPPSAATAARKADQPGTAGGEHAFDFLVRVTRRRKRRGAVKEGEESRRRKRRAAVKEGEESKDAEGPSIHAELLGQISTSVSFPGLCDFQLLAPPAPEIELDLPQLWPATAAAPPAAERFQPNRVGDCVLAPLLFSRYDYTRDYHFANHENANAALRAAVMQGAVVGARAAPESEDEEKVVVGSGSKRGAKRPREEVNHAALDEIDEEDAEDVEDGLEDAGEDASAEMRGGAKRSRKARRYFVTYDPPPIDVPSGPDAGTPFAEAAYQARPIVQRLRRYFVERPSWSTDALVLKLEEEQKSDLTLAASAALSRQDLLHHLIAVAYRFSGGPWRNLWIRYGYDPRQKAIAMESRLSVDRAAGVTDEPATMLVCACFSSISCDMAAFLSLFSVPQVPSHRLSRESQAIRPAEWSRHIRSIRTRHHHAIEAQRSHCHRRCGSFSSSSILTLAGAGIIVRIGGQLDSDRHSL